MKMNKLTKEEERVIVNRGTEMPFTGEYDSEFREGMYVCRRCEAPLYKSDDKFDAHCGWPAFDKEIPGAVIKHKETNIFGGVELECARCHAHLGHVFYGEGFTQTNARHCVNSISMKFITKDKIKEWEKAHKDDNHD